MEAREFLAQIPVPTVGKWLKEAYEEIATPPIRESKPLPTRMISVIIPAHNEEAYLAETIEALQRQNYKWFEVIVVANGCTDRTADIARSRCNRLIVLSQKCLGIARNLGARMARGEILLFLDADTRLEPMALRVVAEAFVKECAAATVKGRPDREELRYKTVYYAKNLVHRLRIHAGSSGVIVCWKEHFLRVGGFDEGLEVRENSELIRRLRRFGGYRYIGDVAATTSMRRYCQRGFGRMLLLWTRVWLQSHFGDLHHRRYEPVR